MADTRRLEAFSDGVLAVAITLLILSVADPGTPHTTLAQRLVHLWPAYASYAVSFLVIGIIWVNHHDAFKEIRYADRAIQFINLLLLMTVVAIPFPTSLLAAHLTSGADSHAAAFAYGLVMTLMGATFTALWVHAARTPAILGDRHDASYAWRRARRSGYGPLVYAAGALLGLLSAPASLGLSPRWPSTSPSGHEAPAAADSPP